MIEEIPVSDLANSSGGWNWGILNAFFESTTVHVISRFWNPNARLLHESFFGFLASQVTFWSLMLIS